MYNQDFHFHHLRLECVTSTHSYCNDSSTHDDGLSSIKDVIIDDIDIFEGFLKNKQYGETMYNICKTSNLISQIYPCSWIVRIWNDPIWPQSMIVIFESFRPMTVEDIIGCLIIPTGIVPSKIDHFILSEQILSSISILLFDLLFWFSIFHVLIRAALNITHDLH